MSPSSNPQESGEHIWRTARDSARTAYRRWSEAPRGQHRVAYAAYLAAEEQEAAAAGHLWRATARAA